jgi:hypothetical protein
VKSAAPFSGFRDRLIGWLEYLGVHRALGLSTAAALWNADGHRYRHSTSAVRYPVLKHGNNYTGRNPSLVGHSILRGYVLDVRAPELAMIPGALVIPLGVAVGQATDLLVREGRLDPDRCLSGFPHPSGANGIKDREWAANRDALRRAVTAWFRVHPVH